MRIAGLLASTAIAAGGHAAWAKPPILLGGLNMSYTTQAAAAELQQICPSGVGYPAQVLAGQERPASAVSGQPRIEQYRQNVLIATYTSFSDQPGCVMAGDGTDNINPGPPAASGCGPFTRDHSYRLWQPGDTFLVYPAVYSGPYNQPWIGPEYDDSSDYSAGISHTPDNVSLVGVVQNNTRPVILLDGPASDNTLGQAPVYFDRSNNFTMDGINVMAGPHAAAGKAGVYEDGGSNLTLADMRIAFFARAGVNGLFGAGNYSGFLSLHGLELDHNGGPYGPAHNAYIGASAVDPNFSVIMHHSWSHHAYYGHLFKSRAQVNTFTANYFEGGLPFGRYTQAEAYLLDVPNGGMLTARNNVFVKNASGADANGMSVTFLMEGYSDARTQSIDIENNTFITYAETFDGSHPNYPFSFFYPSVRPDSPAWPSTIPVRVIKNAFVGYCPAVAGSPQAYVGDLSLTESFAETAKDFSFSTKVAADDAVLAALLPSYQPELGTLAYQQQLQGRTIRKAMTLGAKD